MLNGSKREILFTNLLAATVGISVGYASLGFRHLIGFFQNLMLHRQLGFELLDPAISLKGPLLFILPALGILVSYLLTFWFAKEAEGHGVPEVMEAVRFKGGIVRKRVVGVKILASSLTVATGGSVGREGPIVQIGAAIGSVIGQFFKLRPRLIKTLLGCGAAGAIGATFNTPIAGVIFAIELIVLELKTKSFVPLVISTVFATIITRIHLGNEIAFQVAPYAFKDPRELFFYAGLGFASAIVGTLFVYTLYGSEDVFKKINLPYWAKPLIGGLILSTIAYFFPQVLGVGYETMTDVLQQNVTFQTMLILVIVKLFATSITIAAGGSGGVFTPSLFLGAVLGGAYGYVVHSLFPDISANYGAYALVGMAAMFSATARATFTSMVILFEMTADYAIILPLMFACVISDQLAWILSKESIYTLKFKRRGIHYDTEIGINIFSVTHVHEIMTKDLITATDEMTLLEAERTLLTSGHHTFPVIDPNRQITGIVTDEAIRNELDRGKQTTIEYIKTKAEFIVYPQQTILHALSGKDFTKDSRLIVVDPITKSLQGVVSGKDIMRLSLKSVDS